MTRYIKTEINALRGREPRRLFYIASAERDLARLPESVKEEFVTALTVARLGGHPSSAKPWKGMGSGVLELVEDYRGDTYRAVYTVRFQEAMYVLHVFQKKSKTGSKTPQPDIEKVTKRLKDAEQHYAETFQREKAKGDRGGRKSLR